MWCVWRLICVCGRHQILCPVSFLSPLVFPSFLLSSSNAFSSLCSCIMWSGWTCIVIRPYGGGGFSESAWRRLNNSKQSFCLWKLHWDKLDLSAVLFSQPDGGLTSNPDVTRILLSTVFEKPFLCTFCFIIFTSFGRFTFFILFSQVCKVQTD